MTVKDKRTFGDGSDPEPEPDPIEEVAPESALRASVQTDRAEEPDELQQLQRLQAEVSSWSPERLQEVSKEADVIHQREMVDGAADFLNSLHRIDPEWTLLLAMARMPASQKLVEAHARGETTLVPMPTKDGGHYTGLLGLINAMLMWIGCEDRVGVDLKVDKRGKAISVTGFARWNPEKEGADQCDG